MSASRTVLILSSAVLLALTAYTALPQAKDGAKPPPKAGKEAADQRVLKIDYDSLESDAKNETADFKKAILTDLDAGTVFQADTVHVNSKKGVQTADAEGSLLINDPQADVTGEKAVIHYAKSKRIAVLTGNVVITVKPKKDEKAPPSGPATVSLQNGKATVQPQEDDPELARSARKYPATITCDKVEYHYGKDKKYAKLTGNFKVVQHLPNNTRTLTAEYAEWFGKEDRILLYPPVQFEETKGEKKGSSKDQVTIFTRDDNEKLIMQRGIMTFKIEDEEEEKTPPPPKKGGQ